MEGYSKILSWEVWNFMSIEHAVCEFDDSNIINLKGYNDSGKSAMLTALKVCLTNSNPTKQVGFIMDDKDYFRVLVRFDDDVRLMRDKYRNGQSLYELYKGDQLAYSTKSENGSLTKVSDVPDPIKQYLGLIEYDHMYLNFRSCFEKQIGVQTTGSENYKMFNTVLKSEEIATAGTLLNNDKNKLLSDINSVDSEINANKSILGVGQFLKQEEIDYLKEHDAMLDSYEKREQVIDGINSVKSEMAGIIITPELSDIDGISLEELKNIKVTIDNLNSIIVPPEIDIIDSEQLNLVNSISKLYGEFKEIEVAPSVNEIDTEQLNTLKAIDKIISDINECDTLIKEDNDRLIQLDSEVSDLQKKSEELGVKMVRCPNCGEVFNQETAHIH